MKQLSLFSEKEMLSDKKPVSIPKKAEKAIIEKRFCIFSFPLYYESEQEKAEALEELYLINFQCCVHTDLIIDQLCGNESSFFHVPGFESVDAFDEDEEFYFWFDEIQTLILSIDSDIKAELFKLQKYWEDNK